MGSLYIRRETGEYPFTPNHVRGELRNISLGKVPTDELLASLGFDRVLAVTKTEGDVVTEGAPILKADGFWYQTWSVRPYTQQEIADNEQARINAIQIGIVAVDKWTLLADGIDKVKITYTTESVAHFVVSNEVYSVQPIDKVAELSVSVSTPGPVKYPARKRPVHRCCY